MTDDTLPPLPTGAVDFDVLVSELNDGTAPADAVKRAAPVATILAETADGEILPEDQPHPFVTETGGGWFAVQAPWMDEPEKVRGLNAANARATELFESGRPAD